MPKFVRGKSNHQKLQQKEKLDTQTSQDIVEYKKKSSKWRTIKLT